jgi:hypothetical protein
MTRTILVLAGIALAGLAPRPQIMARPILSGTSGKSAATEDSLQ